MLFKTVIIVLFIFILYSLGTALFTFMKDHGQSQRTVKALTFRIGLSIALFIILLIGYAAGLIQPHGIQ